MSATGNVSMQIAAGPDPDSRPTGRYENWSLALDLQILWKTGSAVLRGAGAY